MAPLEAAPEGDAASAVSRGRDVNALPSCFHAGVIPQLVLATLVLAAPAAQTDAQARHQAIASHQFKLREVARIVDTSMGLGTLASQWSRDPFTSKEKQPDTRRITIVATVVETRRVGAMEGEDAGVKAGEIVVIDYVVDYAQRAREVEAGAKKTPPVEVMVEPDPPVLDEKGEFWAHLAPVAQRLGNVNRHAGRLVNMESSNFKGPVFVPVAGQYSFVAPVAAKTPR